MPQPTPAADRRPVNRSSVLLGTALAAAVHLATGALITARLLTLSLGLRAWPLLPVGYVICTTNWYGDLCWYSVLPGWAGKVLALRLGRPRLYQAGKPVFVGL